MSILVSVILADERNAHLMDQMISGIRKCR
jgi:hypothetical protein